MGSRPSAGGSSPGGAVTERACSLGVLPCCTLSLSRQSEKGRAPFWPAYPQVPLQQALTQTAPPAAHSAALPASPSPWGPCRTCMGTRPVHVAKPRQLSIGRRWHHESSVRQIKTSCHGPRSRLALVVLPRTRRWSSLAPRLPDPSISPILLPNKRAFSSLVVLPLHPSPPFSDSPLWLPITTQPAPEPGASRLSHSVDLGVPEQVPDPIQVG